MGNLKKRLQRLEGGQVGTAIVIVKPGETEGEAWQKHLVEHPEHEKAETVSYVSYF